MFDPAIALNHHIALLHIRDALAAEMDKHKGITQMAIRSVGKLIMTELQKSKMTMRDNKTWIAEQPIDGRYRYSCMGHAGLHGIDEATLELHKQMAIEGIGQRIKQLWEERE